VERINSNTSEIGHVMYFLVVWLGEIFCSARIAASFGEHDINKCLNNLFIVLEQTNRINFASFSDLQCYARDQSCCWWNCIQKASRSDDQ